MSLLQSFRNLSARNRALVGVGLLAWGAIGLQLSDRVEDRYFRASDEDREALRSVLPRITAVDRDSGSGDREERGGKGRDP